MKISTGSHIEQIGSIIPILLLALVFAVGCETPVRKEDPLAGWKVLLSRDSDKLDPAITADYKGYIQNLPARERYYVQDYNVWFLEDGTGQHAVRIQIPLNGTWWDYVLVYNKDNKRINVIKYASGRYRS